MNENIIINPELSNKIPPLTTEEYQGLEKSIIREGCRDALILWNDTLVDGHNRYKICTEHNIEFKTIQMDFENILYAREWIIVNLFARRHLDSYQRSKLALELEDIYKKEAKNRMLSGKKTDPQQISAEGQTRDKIAKIANVSHDTIDKVKKIEAKASDEIKEQVASGELSINQGYKKINVHVGQNSGENEWYTPSNIIEAARNTMGSIDLDPATSEIANQTIKATEIFTEETNGLDKTWSGNVWLNPPYAQPLMTEFSDKLLKELSNISQACVLINNATETNWFQDLVIVSSAHCLVKGRVKFLDVNGKPGAPLQGQIILYFGSDLDKFYDNFNIFGPCGIIMTKKEAQ